MKKLLIGIVILVVFIVAVFFLLKSSKPKPGPIVFDLAYRGLSGSKDELRYNSYWGFGAQERDTPFIEEVKKNGGEFTLVYNSHFKGAEWSAVEVKDNKAVAFYFDLNADGKVSENEKILPIQGVESDSSDRTEFVTPDFVMTTQNDRQVPFRILLQVAFYGQSERPNCMWSPSCILEGTSAFEGNRAKFILYTGDFSGAFDKFGRSAYSLLPEGEQSGQYIPRQMLSSIISYRGRFYNLKLEGAHEQGKNIRAVLEEYAGPSGALAVKLTGKTNLKARLSSASVVGSKEETIRFNIGSDQARLPAGAFRLESGYVNYNSENEDQWRVNFKEGPEFKVEANQTGYVEIGEPNLSIQAVEEARRYHSDVEEQTVYSKGTNVYISRIVKGKAGEIYGRFYERSKDIQNYQDVQPDLKILDAEGREIAAAKLEYG